MTKPTTTKATVVKTIGDKNQCILTLSTPKIVVATATFETLASLKTKFGITINQS